MFRLLRALFSFHVIWEQTVSPAGDLCVFLSVPFSCHSLFTHSVKGALVGLREHGNYFPWIFHEVQSVPSPLPHHQPVVTVLKLGFKMLDPWVLSSE